MDTPQQAAARLRWRCRRGVKELDLLLQGFLERRYPRLSAREQALFRRLLDETDPDIHAWVTGRTRPENPDYLSIIDPLRQGLRHLSG